MRLLPKRKQIPLEETPPEVIAALFTIGHWLANTGQDMNTNFNITEGPEVVQYEIEMREIKRYPWLVEAEQ